MTDKFTNELMVGLKKSILKIVTSGDMILPDYENRLKIPKEYIMDVWDMVDHEKVKQEMTAIIEKDLAKRIMNHLATEMATDMKQLLSDKERRESLRNVARDNLHKICNPLGTING